MFFLSEIKIELNKLRVASFLMRQVWFGQHLNLLNTGRYYYRIDDITIKRDMKIGNNYTSPTMTIVL